MTEQVFCPTCGYVECVCELIKNHAPHCRLLISALCPVSIECEHGFDFCPTCDKCTCNGDMTLVLKPLEI